MSNLYYRNPRLMALTIVLILVGGASSFYVLPRMEDPLLTERVAMFTTRLGGADAERVESLVTEKLESKLQEFDEIKETRSISRAGISVINVELQDNIYDVDPVWSRIRDKVDEASPELPADALEPEFTQFDMKAYAMIISLSWDQSSSDGQPTAPNYAILRRLAEQLDDKLLEVAGTEKVKTFGDPEEEIIVTVNHSKLTALGLSAASVSSQIRASDSKVTAGLLRGREDMLLEVGGEFDSIERIRRTPIQYGTDGRFVRLSDVATVTKGIREPQATLALVRDQPAIALGVLVLPGQRVDHWSAEVDAVIRSFSESLPRGVRLETIFTQNNYVQTRLDSLFRSLMLGATAVILVVLVMMGWRSALIVGATLPLAASMVLTGMRFLDVPIHQMSITGLIIALGLLIDNAIVIVDEVNVRMRDGESPASAVSKSVSHLALPLFGSTATTAFAFAPIALMPGPAGEFVGSIATSVILAIFSSFFLAMTVVPALAALGRSLGRAFDGSRQATAWWQDGLHLPSLLVRYRATLNRVFSRPVIGIAGGTVLPVLGFIAFSQLPEQFFPRADRDQFQIELELPSTSSIAETTSTARAIRNRILDHDQVAEVSWFVGESSPMFYYNVIPRRQDTSSYAQALVQLKPGAKQLEIIHRLQAELDANFSNCRVLVRQLEQGPPFDAPVEIRIFGPDLEVLRTLGDQVRLVLSQTSNVVHTRADLSETVPKLSLDVDEDEARLAGLNHTEIANQLSATLEGAVGGSILEETEELPVRVRVDNDERGRIESITSLQLLSSSTPQQAGGLSGVPVSALARLSLVPQSASVPRHNQRRMNEVQAYVRAGILPATVVSEYESRIANSSFKLPLGYSIEYGGEASKRDDAVGNLLVNVGMLVVLMAATLVLSFKSFRIAAIIAVVAALSSGLGVGALWVFGYPFGFMAIVGTMGLIGVAINDTIVVLAAITEDEQAKAGDPQAVSDVVVRATRHVLATTLTTIAGFIPLMLGGGGFWPPLAVTIAGGVGGATILALYFTPAAYIVAMCRGVSVESEDYLDVRREQRSDGPEVAALPEPVVAG